MTEITNVHQAERKVERAAHHATDAAAHQAHQLKKDVEAKVEDVKEFAAEKKDEISTAVKEKVEDVQDYAADKQVEINKSVHEHPYATAAGAFAGGVAVGAMLAKHKDEHKDAK